jgi:hypothetical protein
MKLTRMTRTAGWLAVAGLLSAALIAPTATFAVMGPEVAPTTVLSANITSCPEGFGATIVLNTNTTSDSAAGVTVSITYNSGPKTVDFTATGGVVWHAYIKGGNDYNWYNYTPLGGVAADDGLVAPNNASGGPAGLSHAVFCVAPTTTTTTETTDTSTTTTETTDTSTTTTETTDTSTTTTETTDTVTTTTETTDTSTTSTQTTETTETTDTETTDTETTDTETTETPEGSVEAETGTPDVTPPSTDTIGGAGTSGPSTSAWQLLLVAMAGLLATVLLLTPAAEARKR